MSEKLIAFFVFTNSEGIINISTMDQWFAHSFDKFDFAIANKDKCGAVRETHSHTTKFPVHDIAKTKFN